MMWRSVLLRNPTGEAQPDDPAGDLFHGLEERIGTQSSGGADTLPPAPEPVTKQNTRQERQLQPVAVVTSPRG